MINPDHEIAFLITYYIIDFLILISSLVFIISFLKMRDTNHGVYMILILSISDILFPLLNLYLKLFDAKGAINIVAPASAGIYQFGLLWSTSIAIFVFVIFKYKNPFNPRLFFIHSFLSCIVVSMIVVIM